ncbi:MAG TPA: hypothetical protein VJT31_15910 [Rugosimonospora sp.]|nr:hypothetical protein [Rugosimonospora sp.]
MEDEEGLDVADPATNPWRNGPPSTLRYVAENPANDDRVYAIMVGEYQDGSGRTITIQIETGAPDEETIRCGMNTYSVWLEPCYYSFWGDITEWVIADRTLTILLTPQRAEDLGFGPRLRFQLALDDDQVTLLRAGLQHTLATGREDRQPLRLDLR